MVGIASESVGCANARLTSSRTDDLLLLHRKWEASETWTLSLEDSRVETIVVLSYITLVERTQNRKCTCMYKMDNHAAFLADRNLPGFHLPFIVFPIRFANLKRKLFAFTKDVDE